MEELVLVKPSVEDAEEIKKYRQWKITTVEN